MKKIFACVLAVCPMVASADYLDDKIAALTKEKLDKIAKLEECQKSTKGLKIAGITTLGVSAIGIGANIGEAVALKNYDAKINTAVQTKSDLEVQIIDAQRKKAEEEAAKLAAQSGVNLVNQPVVTPGVDVNNTCGTKTCDAATPTQSGLDLLNATEAVCKDGNWVAKTCKENYSGTQQTCTLNGATITYIDSCKPVVTPGVDVNNTCGTKTCDAAAPTQSGLDLLNATEAVCKDGNWVAKTCKDNYSGTQQTCTLNGATVTYIDSCRLTAPTEKQCPQVTDEWKAQNNAKSGACDTTTGQLYITECADTHTEVKDTNGRITECQQKQEQTQPVVQERKHHEMCTAAETAAIPNAVTSWWYNGKCVAKSCKPNTYLHVKNGVSQGQCMTACPAWQITDWANGGQACDVAKPKPVDPTPVQEQCQEKKQGWAYWKKTSQTCGCETTVCGKNYRATASSTDSGCMDRCVQYLENKINDRSIELKPDPSMNNSTPAATTKAELSACKQNSIPGITNDMSCNLACDKYATGANCKLTEAKVSGNACYCNPAPGVIKPGRDMGGAMIKYTYSYDSANYDAIGTFTVDGQKYSAIGHVMVLGPSKHKQVLNRAVEEKLESLGYTNFQLYCNGCP